MKNEVRKIQSRKNQNYFNNLNLCMADIGTHSPIVVEHRIDTSRAEEGELHSLLKLSGTEEGFQVHKVQDNVFAVGWENTEYFCDKQGSVLLNLYYIRGNTLPEKLKVEWKKTFQAIAWQAGYREEKDPKTGVYTLYNFQSWENKVVPKNTPEYFQAWKDIEMFNYRLDVVIVAEWPFNEGENRDATFKNALYEAKKWYVRIRDLLILASPRVGKLTQEQFQAVLPFARDHLLEQIGDPRWDRVLSPKKDDNGSYAVSKEELDQYLSLKLIEQPLYEQAIKKLTETEELKRKKSEQSRTLMESTKEKTGNIQPK